MEMSVEFTKMHGTGNDFVMVEDWDSAWEPATATVAALCDRHTGIGADGMILVRPSKQDGCAAYMHYINADGSLAQMCGNGTRCLAKYLVDREYVDRGADTFAIETLSGVKDIAVTRDAAGLMEMATVDMGAPVLIGENPHVLLESPWGVFGFVQVSMGNPHAVHIVYDWDELPDAVFVSGGEAGKSLDTLDVARIGAFFATHKAFPEGSNIEFAYVDDDGIRMRVYERGCGETLACGTGACATLVAAATEGLVDRESDIAVLGGTLHVAWTEEGNVLLTGPAAEVYRGEIEVA